jgi:hypothetical protein
MLVRKQWSSGPRNIVNLLLKLISRIAILFLKHDYVAHILTFRVMAVPCHNTIKTWVQNFRESASALKRTPRGRIARVRTPKNVEKVRVAIVKGPRRSARRHCASVGLSDRSVR